jgi:hypothetical protein
LLLGSESRDQRELVNCEYHLNTVESQTSAVLRGRSFDPWVNILWPKAWA